MLLKLKANMIVVVMIGFRETAIQTNGILCIMEKFQINSICLI